MTAIASTRPRSARRSAVWDLDRVDVRWMVGLAVLALALRLWFVLSVGQTKDPFDDAGIYDAIAKNLAHGHGFHGLFGQPTAQFPPAWPFLLSLAYRVFDATPTTGEVLNALLGTLTVPVFYFATLRARNRREAIIVGAGTTLLLGQIFWTDVLLAETLTTLLCGLLVALVVVAPPERTRTAVLVGVVLGVLTMTRGEGILLLTMPLAMWWTVLPRRWLGRQVGIIIGVVLVFVIPWTIRNESAMHAFIPVSTNFASTFWSGHNPNANGGPTYPSDRDLASVKAPLTSPRREIETEQVLQKQALHWMLTHPLDELRLIPLKILSLNGGDSQALAIWIHKQSSAKRPVLSPNGKLRLSLLADMETYFLLAAFLGALWVYGRALLRIPILRGILAFLAVSLVLYGFVFYGNFRYRSVFEPLMLMVAAPLLARIWALRDKRFA